MTPFHLNEYRAKVAFVTAARHPNLIYKACLKTGTVSNTVYIQHAICEALARDLSIPLDELLAELPPPRGRNRRLAFAEPDRIGPGDTVEEVR